MGLFSSQTLKGFFDDPSHDSFPADAIPLSVERHHQLLAGQAEGQVIDFSPVEGPVLIDPPPPSAEALATIKRQWRDECLALTDGVVSRHRDELEDGSPTTLTTDQYADLQAYRRALRNWPESGEFPLSEHRPLSPPWLAQHLQ